MTLGAFLCAELPGRHADLHLVSSRRVERIQGLVRATVWLYLEAIGNDLAATGTRPLDVHAPLHTAGTWSIRAPDVGVLVLFRSHGLRCLSTRGLLSLKGEANPSQAGLS